MGHGRVQLCTLEQEDVQLYEDTKDFTFKSGTDLTLEKFTELVKKMLDVRKRCKPYEKRMRDGTTKQFVRVYDQDDGCWRFDEGQENRLSHQKTIDDGTIS